ncbi:uncharacterized protein LOC113508892 [Trichoplusia ni]|uniref:Uncharacterized protein LOC113508892 n=1 Tax=Trichoplusia ni TaxID=7111 RepID=A0A7E5X3P8_TRINI|nr:uncharacterized protein LOC113508892 [Trichoplusia ni]XP_026747861.1 uncharacterized protein LOC113508892 [Trichoplusia ni]
MWHQLWIPVLIPTLIIKSNCNANRTDPDVFVRGGHADAEYFRPTTSEKVTEAETETTTVKTTVKVTISTAKPTTTVKYEDDADVMFIPNKPEQAARERERDREKERDDDEDDKYANLRIKDLMMMKSVNDVLNKNFHVDKPDPPNEDIVFITGKNHERNDDGKRSDDNIVDYIDDDMIQRPKLNCSDLDCNNTIHSVCGAKVVNRELKYRLFLNDCYFRKVNCAFKYEINRYRQVTVDRCKTIGAHYVEKPFAFKPKSFPMEKNAAKGVFPSRSSSSRRSMAMNYNGQFCSHPCPVSCPDEYDPQCAVSGTGQRRVFLNHCKLDYNSCFYGVVWHKRPLAECIGGKKADMRQNRGFIGWMQRVGIVDRKGRLVLE